jgi:hypothetical protein
MVDYVESPLEQIRQIFRKKKPPPDGGPPPPGAFKPPCVPYFDTRTLPNETNVDGTDSGTTFSPRTVYVDTNGYTWLGSPSCCPATMANFYQADPSDPTSVVLLPYAHEILMDESGTVPLVLYRSWPFGYATAAIANGSCNDNPVNTVSVRAADMRGDFGLLRTTVWYDTCLITATAAERPPPSLVIEGTAAVTVDIPIEQFDPSTNTLDLCGTTIFLIYATNEQNGLIIEHSCLECLPG